MTDFIFLGSKITVDGECSHEIKILTPWKESYDEPRQCIKKSIYHFANKGLYSQSYGFSSGHAWMWELDHIKDGAPKGWALRNWCFWIVMLEKTLESPLDWREINPVNLKGNQPWFSLEGLMLKVWPLDAKSWLIGKNLHAGKDWNQKEKQATEDEMGE